MAHFIEDPGSGAARAVDREVHAVGTDGLSVRQVFGANALGAELLLDVEEAYGGDGRDGFAQSAVDAIDASPILGGIPMAERVRYGRGEDSALCQLELTQPLGHGL